MLRAFYQRIHQQSRYPFLSVLALSSIFSIALFAGRLFWTKEPTFSFLVWNLFLALLPVFFSFYINPDQKRKWVAPVFMVLWLLFFPNSPYIITDLLHLRPRPEIPMWYDVMLILSFAWTGLMAGYYSLFQVLDFIRSRKSPVFTQIAGVVFLGLASYGVYLGRMRRWNSWDLFSKPVALLEDTIAPILNPFFHFRVIAMCAALFGFLVIGFLALQALMASRPLDSRKHPGEV